MKKDKLKLYFSEIILMLVLFIALFVSNRISRIALSIILLIFTCLIRFTSKKRRIIKHISKEVAFLMAGLGLIYVGVFYAFGFIVYKFSRQAITFSISTILRYIIPLTIIIVCSEYIRYWLLSQDGRIRIRNTNKDYAKSLTLFNMVLIDLVIYVGVYSLTNLNSFLSLIGFIAFASISSNIFYNYYTHRFGVRGIIIYRLITVLYVYIIPIVPKMYIYFRSFIRMIYPYIMYLILESTYGKTNVVEPYNTRKKEALVITFSILFMAIFTMLISCQFKYGILVIGSESMTGAINKGDATIYESYNGQTIKNGDIIIFNYKNTRLIHRVVDSKKVNGEIRYYTKGDINATNDPEYRIKSDIIGISRINIKYLGIPTLWLNELFK